MFLSRVIDLFGHAGQAVRRAGRAIRSTAADFAMGVILYLLAAAFLLTAALVLGLALYRGLKAVMHPGAALTIIGLLLLIAALVSWGVGRSKVHGPRD